MEPGGARALSKVKPRDPDLMRRNAARANALVKAMANKWRFLILCHVADGEKSVAELQTRIGLSQSSLSQHLAVLRRDNLVKTRRQAKSILYSLASDEAATMMATLNDLFGRDSKGGTPHRSAL